MGQLDQIPQEYIQMTKNTSIYRRIGRNRPISLINGRDETVHHEPL